MSPDLLMIASFLLALLMGVPVAIALGVGGVVGIVAGLPLAMLGTFGTNTYNSVAKYPLIAIPLFILTGLIFERAGVAASLVRFAQAIIGPRHGGLTVVAVLVCLIMGGMSGSGPADAAAVAMVMLPSMKKAGYPQPFSASLIAASSSTAILIPPSIALILYSIVVPGVDLRALFAAGLFPGILAGVSLLAPALYFSRKYRWEDPETVERPPLWPSFKAALPALFAPVIILGGLRSGLFTPTEAAVVAVTSGVVMFIIALAGIFAWAGATLGTFQHLADALLSLSENGWVLLGLVMVLVLIAGMLLDAISIYLILIPIVLPLMNHFGWNPIWFGILLAMNTAIGQFTPPVAVNLMVTTRIANIRLEHTIGWALVFIAAMAASLLVVMLMPGIALWLPEKLGYVVGPW